jgi:exopolysaccharide biosynthesis protein
VKRSLADMEKAQEEAKQDRKSLKEQLRNTEKTVQSLQSKQQNDAEISKIEHMYSQLVEELDDERKQHEKDINDANFASEQTRNKYQGKIYSTRLIIAHTPFSRVVST